MVKSGVQLLGCVLGCIGGVCIILCTIIPEWKTNESTDLDALLRYEGLWIKCVTYPSGQWQCEEYDAFFIDLPKSLQIGRALSCAAIAISFAAFVATVLGMSCTTGLTSEEGTKRKVAMTAALLWVVTSICIGIAVTYYAYLVLWEYSNGTSVDVASLGHQYIYGPCLYLGWAALTTCFSAGVLIGCASRPTDNEWSFSSRSNKLTTNHISKSFLKTEYV